MDKKNILVVGAGAWGTALAINFENCGHKIFLKTRNKTLCQQINLNNINPLLSDNLVLPKSIEVSEKDPSNIDIIIFAVPSENLVEAAEVALNNYDKSNIDIIIATKGLNHNPVEFFSDYFLRNWNINPLFLSGPSFASEVAMKLPTACDLACHNLNKAEEIAKSLSCDNFKLIPNNDIVSIQISGCYKNILAIYCGYILEQGLGQNFHAKICTDALRELEYICKKLGAPAKTIYSYSGLGDIMLSCFSEQSRNFKYGAQIAKFYQKNISPLNVGYVEGIKVSQLLAKLCEPFYNELVILPKVIELIIKYQEDLCHL